MRYAIILLALLTACSSPTKDEGFEPYMIGTWLVESEDKAEWQGSNYKAKGDTVTIVNTNEHGLTIKADSRYPDAIIFTIEDETIQEGDINPVYSRLLMPTGAFKSDGGAGHFGLDADYEKGYLTLRFTTDVNCDYDGNNPVLVLKLHQTLEDVQNDNPHIVYNFQADGYIDVAKVVDICPTP